MLTGRVALADPGWLGLGLTIYVGFKASDRGDDWSKAFLAAVRIFPRLMKVCRMAGERDYLLRVAMSAMTTFIAV